MASQQDWVPGISHTKDPKDNKLYPLFIELEPGDTLIEHTVNVPQGLTLVSHGRTENAIVPRLKGGVHPQDYACLYSWKTAFGDEGARTVLMKVRNL